MSSMNLKYIVPVLTKHKICPTETKILLVKIVYKEEENVERGEAGKMKLITTDGTSTFTSIK